MTTDSGSSTNNSKVSEKYAICRHFGPCYSYLQPLYLLVRLYFPCHLGYGSSRIIGEKDLPKKYQESLTVAAAKCIILKHNIIFFAITKNIDYTSKYLCQNYFMVGQPVAMLQNYSI